LLLIGWLIKDYRQVSICFDYIPEEKMFTNKITFW